MVNQRDEFVYYIVKKYLEILCKFMQINLDVYSSLNEKLYRCITSMSYIECVVVSCKQTNGEVVMSSVGAIT